ncbi:2OG-Fe(II) oxygenase [Sorangium sp. So ce362]|uniref:2OG-Fe(II) oxygenase n=1 Tax=Sorangium sp. So ce362 TaxID=3133303 RepID=UPI003F647BAC
MLDEVTAALAAVEAEGEFATELGCGSDDLHIEIEGVGPIRFPISIAAARKLCAVADPAPYGRRDRTVHDVRVRDTWEIDRRRISIDTRRWRRTLEPRLAILRQRLGLPEEGKLEAALDKMLVYGPGQFFAPHQDSERDDDMVGSLVVELPSRHEGGAIVVQHHRETKVFPSATRGPKDLSLIAFYADCHHEVKPVDAGYRITLTYHLLFRGAAEARVPLRPPAVERLCASVKAYFSTPVAIPYSKAPPQRPDRLIYLLDHEYTQKSLGWGRLKNADRLRAAALRQVAERLDCEVYLALADVHESWSCEGDDWDDGYGRRAFGRRDDASDDARDAEDHELIELIMTDVELRHWVGPDGRLAPGLSAHPASHEICFTRGSVEMDPFRSEHEGYMGNYGNTVDRWYHRAALVMWPRDRDFVVRAKIDPSWAVDELAARIDAGATDEARERANELLPFWSQSAPKDTDERFFLKLLEVSAALGDANLALGLLSPLGPHWLGPRTTPAFVALVQRYGLEASQRVFSAWAEDARYDTPPWRSFLPRLCEALWAGGEHGKALAAWVLSREVASFKQSYTGALRLPGALREEGVERHLDDTLALLETAAVIQAPSIRDDLIASLTAPETALPVMMAGALLRRCREGRTPAAVRALGLQALYRRVVGSLERILAAKSRSSDDWSIEPPSGCTCDLCKGLSVFLRDRGRIEHAWPLAKERRRHIHDVIELHRLPLTHTTIRSGRPQTLVLTKQKALFERDAELRARQKALLAWLKKEGRAFSETHPSAASS